MRKCDEHQTQVHLDVHVCPVFVCVCGGGDTLIKLIHYIPPYLSVYCLNLHQFLILCSSKAMMFVKLYFRTSDIYLISLVSLERNRCHPLKKNQYTMCTASVIVNISAS